VIAANPQRVVLAGSVARANVWIPDAIDMSANGAASP
jgi:hypothetical protein